MARYQRYSGDSADLRHTDAGHSKANLAAAMSKTALTSSHRALHVMFQFPYRNSLHLDGARVGVTVALHSSRNLALSRISDGPSSGMINHADHPGLRDESMPCGPRFYTETSELASYWGERPSPNHRAPLPIWPALRRSIISGRALLCHTTYTVFSLGPSQPMASTFRAQAAQSW